MDLFVAPPAKKSTAEMASSTLWEYQLRRENRAILEKIRAFSERRDADVSVQVKRMEQADQELRELAAKVEELEKEQKSRDAREAEHQRLCAAKIAEMEKLLKGRMTDEEFKKMRSDARTKVAARSNAEPASPPTARPSTSQRSAHAGAQNARQEVIMSNPAAPSKLEDRPAKQMKVANHRPATRSTSSGGKALPGSSQQPGPFIAVPVRTTSSPQLPAPSSFPKLSQKHRTLKQYYDRAHSIFQSMNFTDPQLEYDFINAFIAGLDTKKNSEKLIKALEAVHPSTVQAYGVEIRCEWEDIPAGLKRAGLDISGAREEIKRKKRTLNPRTQLETGFAN